MKKLIPLIITLAISLTSAAYATQADDTAVAVTGQAPGASAFIKKVKLRVSDPAALRSIQFTIAPKDRSVTRPVSATYLPTYLNNRGFFNSTTNVFTLPVWGLYAGRAN
ncbi:MAG: hypothetical protein H0X73_11715, partial [Chthoniobacterales bacterium]|nr:hypothetical protein [Chthoniobacterales bacterium]